MNSLTKEAKQNIIIENLRRKPDYYKNIAPEWVRTFWPRQQSMDHFLKSNRDELVRYGGIAKLGRDWFVDIERFPIAVRKILGLEITK